MKQQPHSGRPARSAVKHKAEIKPNFNLALRKCEEASVGLLSTSEELAACWIALGIEISTGATRTELLRRRAWCNVLELRLKEKAALLEKARHGMDEVWTSVLHSVSTHETSHRAHYPAAVENLFSKSWSLLMQPKSAARPSELVTAKPS
ncbi:MAG: hypothetical protein H7Y43_06055 [Akkermansiaceae bacterium]|nr:hypothetical protein [Verrucomicrobiales bacterium]